MTEFSPMLGGLKGWGGYHPSLSDVMEREAEIAAWDISKFVYDVQVRLRILGTILCVGLAVLMFGYNRPGVALFFTLVAALILWHRPRRPLMRPRELKLVQFTDWENENMLPLQEWDNFSAWCPCPSCGYVDSHAFRDYPEPWAEVVRICKMCHREWGQA